MYYRGAHFATAFDFWYSSYLDQDYFCIKSKVRKKFFSNSFPSPGARNHFLQYKNEEKCILLCKKSFLHSKKRVLVPGEGKDLEKNVISNF